MQMYHQAGFEGESGVGQRNTSVLQYFCSNKTVHDWQTQQFLLGLLVYMAHVLESSNTK